MSVLAVSNGKVVDNTSSTSSAAAKSSASGTSSLDKNAFLQLLVAQMKYQDPLNPSTDTQYVQQLATFSQLEQMQNLNTTTSNNQAFGLVGMEVEVSTTDKAGKSIVSSGRVDYVLMSNGTAKVSVNGSLYSLDQVTTVLSSDFVIEQGLPYINQKVDATFDKDKPEDISFTVNLGSGKTVATDVAVIINNAVVDSKYVKISGTKVTISKDAFAKLDNGTYKPTVMFNDANYTVVSNQINITVKGTGPVTNPDDTPKDPPKDTPGDTPSNPAGGTNS